MCGVIGLICEHFRNDLGRVAADLLKTLEYRGYDSTGGALQGRGLEVQLVKGVGAPSVMVDQLGITEMAGQIFCGQVRWATFGAVTDKNSQPHLVQCKTLLYGAHNGNITNCDDLKAWLTSEGHQVLSDNDGEMVVHTVEHYFAQELGPDEPQEASERRAAMRRALLMAAKRLEGSYAAVIVDPVSRTVWAIKQGSSLYFGIGQDEASGRFGIASSDLSSVLKLTRVVVPLLEGDFVEYTPEAHTIYAICPRVVREGKAERQIAAGEELRRSPVRSRLRAKDTALLPPFETFMDQEISAQEETARNVVTLFRGGSEGVSMIQPTLAACPSDDLAAIRADLDLLRDEYDDEVIRAQFHALVQSPPLAGLLDAIPPEIAAAGIDEPAEQLAERLVSSDAGFFTDLFTMARDRRDLLAVRLFDVLLEREEVQEFATAVDRFAGICMESLARGGRIFAVCCGTSYHAAKAATLFFNEIARTELIPILPG
ncbi:MAG: glutamine--fructose-6-phosphate aminotransferase, partial [Deltaproteobacteria bacterium]|nr:glutamine--fructose-6-phosphate aminotransferase [Deltaproteobacteria bacterium]